MSGHPGAMAVGDMVQVHDNGGEVLLLPGIAPVAMQQGKHAAHVIRWTFAS